MPAVAEQIRRACRTKPWGRFQVHGVRFLINKLKSSGALLADDMGLGKTYQVAVYLKLHPELRPVIVVCPSAVKYAWERELWDKTRIRSQVLDGTDTREPITESVIIINYDILKYWLHKLTSLSAKRLIFDECHKIKSLGAQRTQAALSLAKTCKKVIGLSGTPITRGPADFFPILHLIAKHVFPSWQHYSFCYCAPKRFRGKWKFNGATNLKELRGLIEPFMLRRRKEDVLPELPQVVPTVIPVKMSKVAFAEYVHARDDFIDWYKKNKGAGAARRAQYAEQIVRLNQLRQLAAAGIIDTAVEWMKDWRRNNNGAKMVIFAHHKKVVTRLREVFPQHACITGAVTGKKRQKEIDRFQTDKKCPWFIGNLQAAGEGTTLTAAPITVTVELAWVPTTHDQADDRINRIGQTAKHLDNIYFIAKGTIMEHIWEVLETRRDIIAQVVDGKAAGAVQNLVIEKLLQEKR